MIKVNIGDSQPINVRLGDSPIKVNLSNANLVGGGLPDQSGNAGKVLGTDGTDASWVKAGGVSGNIDGVSTDFNIGFYSHDYYDSIGSRDPEDLDYVLKKSQFTGENFINKTLLGGNIISQYEGVTVPARPIVFDGYKYPNSSSKKAYEREGGAMSQITVTRDGTNGVYTAIYKDNTYYVSQSVSRIKVHKIDSSDNDTIIYSRIEDYIRVIDFKTDVNGQLRIAWVNNMQSPPNYEPVNITTIDLETDTVVGTMQAPPSPTHPPYMGSARGFLTASERIVVCYIDAQGFIQQAFVYANLLGGWLDVASYLPTSLKNNSTVKPVVISSDYSVAGALSDKLLFYQPNVNKMYQLNMLTFTVSEVSTYGDTIADVVDIHTQDFDYNVYAVQSQQGYVVVTTPTGRKKTMKVKDTDDDVYSIISIGVDTNA